MLNFLLNYIYNIFEEDSIIGKVNRDNVINK